MKKITTITILFFFLFSFSYQSFAKENSDIPEFSFPTDENGCTGSEWVENPESFDDYAIHEGYMFDGYCLIKDADIKTFKPLIIDGEELGKYMKDKDSIYFTTKRLNGLNSNYVKLKQIDDYGTILYNDEKIYFNGIEVSNSGIDVETFRLENGSYRDKNYLYEKIKTSGWEGPGIQKFILKRVENADPNNYTDGYKITDDAVYWYGKKIEEVNVDSFEVMHLGYAKDKDNVYYEGVVKHNRDSKTFHRADIEGIDIYVYMDKNKSYSGIEQKTIKEIKKEIPKSKESLNQSIKSTIQTYRENYPHYIPHPAQDSENSDSLYNLKRYFDYYILDYKYLNPPLYYGIITSPFILIFGIGGFVFWRKRKRK